MRGSNVVRWILVIPSAIVAWYLAFFLSLVLGVFLVAPCTSSDGPPAAFCDASWFSLDAVRRGIIFFGVGLSAALVVAAAAFTAPSHRAVVAWIALFSGAVLALVFSYRGSFFVEAAVAIACGAIVAMLVSRRRPRMELADEGR
jgi:hypothetical protein